MASTEEIYSRAWETTSLGTLTSHAGTKQLMGSDWGWSKKGARMSHVNKARDFSLQVSSRFTFKTPQLCTDYRSAWHSASTGELGSGHSAVALGLSPDRAGVWHTACGPGGGAGSQPHSGQSGLRVSALSLIRGCCVCTHRLGVSLCQLSGRCCPASLGTMLGLVSAE